MGKWGCKGLRETREMVPTQPERQGWSWEQGGSSSSLYHLASLRTPLPGEGRPESGGTLVPTSITCFSPSPSTGLASHGAGRHSLELFGLCRGGRVCSQLPEAPAESCESCPCALTRSQAAPLPAPCCAGGAAAAAGWEHGAEQVAGFSSVRSRAGCWDGQGAQQGAGTRLQHSPEPHGEQLCAKRGWSEASSAWGGGKGRARQAAGTHKELPEQQALPSGGDGTALAVLGPLWGQMDPAARGGWAADCPSSRGWLMETVLRSTPGSLDQTHGSRESPQQSLPLSQSSPHSPAW